MPLAFHRRPQSWFQLGEPRRAAAARPSPAGGLAALRLDHSPAACTPCSGYVARSGLFRVLAWPCLFRHYATSDLAEMLEIYGLPIRLGKYPPGTADEEKATLLRAVTGLGHAAAGIIPETMAIDFQQAAQGSSDPFLAMMRQSEDAISKAVLGGTLTSTTSQSGGGAALGRVHSGFGTTTLASDARQLAATRCPRSARRSWY
ncbi:phage portal protein family protein [Pseudomonas aeruginosa]|uniref:phage portal protein family protein n=1 Tax=Pseudomonas aeruginosa TaxID=287 RepID=UPI003D7FEDB4